MNKHQCKCNIFTKFDFYVHCKDKIFNSFYLCYITTSVKNSNDKNIKIMMTTILEILKYILPAIIVFIASWLVLKQMVKNDQNRRNYEIIAKNQQTITPIRLQAYERLTLLLERISPESLIMRLNKPDMKAKQLQAEILSAIRSEFDHNVSQQIYISSQAWELIKNARSTIIQIVNSCANRAKPETPAYLLSKMILEELMKQEKSPVSLALEYLKAEARQMY